MRILYSVGKHSGAPHQLIDFLARSNPDDEIKIAAFPELEKFIPHWDWNLGAYIYRDNKKRLIEDILKFNPNLVIVDGETIIGTLLQKLNFPVFKCSPLHMLDGLKWEINSRFYTAQLEKWRQILEDKLPRDVLRIYSVFGDSQQSPILREKSEWVSPDFISVENTIKENTAKYSLVLSNDLRRQEKISNLINEIGLNVQCSSRLDPQYKEKLSQAEWIVTSGETCYIADALYNGIPYCVTPNINDIEAILNALGSMQFNCGIDIGQIELLNPGAQEELVKAYELKSVKKAFRAWSSLHEKVKQWEHMFVSI